MRKASFLHDGWAVQWGKVITTSFLKRAVWLAALSPLAAQIAAQAQTVSAPSSSGDGDLVVTATRQEVPLSKVPLAVSVLTGKDLRDAGMTDPFGLGTRAPDVSIDRATALQITIRGVTSTDYSEKGDPAAGFMADGIYLARPQEADASFFDVDRIEVLRGPQGTRFGRNTTAGLVDVISNKPVFGHTGMGAHVAYGNYGRASADGYVNLPLGEGTALRIAGLFDRQDSIAHNAPGDGSTLDPFRRDLALRATLRQALGTDGDLLLRVNASSLTGTLASNVPTSHFFSETSAHTPNLDASGHAIWAPISTNTATLLTRDLTSLPIPTAQYGFGASGHTQPWVEDGGWGVDGQIDKQVGPVKAVYLGSYRRYAVHENAEVDLYPYASGYPIPGLGAPNPGCPAADLCSFPSADDGRYHQLSQELRLSRREPGRLQATGGVYYFHEESRTALYIVDSPQFIIGYPNTLYGFPDHTVATSLAGFGEISWRPIETLRLTGGLRYTHDVKQRTGDVVRLTSLAEPLSIPFDAYANDASVSGGNLSWRAGADADVPGGLLYGSVATGYKQGGFGDGCSTGSTTLVTSTGQRCNTALGDPQATYYRPETLTAWELGYRGQVAPGLHLDAALFAYDYRDMQLNSILIINGAPSLATTNAGKAHILGAEMEAGLQPWPHHQVTVGLDLLDGHYAHFCPGGTTTGDPQGPCLAGTADFAGRKLDRAPAQTAYARYNWTVPLRRGMALVMAANTQLKARYAITEYTVSPVQYFIPAHSRTDLAVTLAMPWRQMSVTAYVNNLENFIELQNVTSGSVTPGMPRTFGMRAGFDF